MTTVATDPRLAADTLIHFGTPGLGSSPAKFVGPLTGASNTIANESVRTLGRVATRFLSIASEARTSAGLLPSARAAAVTEAAAPLSKAAGEAAKAFARLALELDHDLRTASVIKPYGEAGGPLPDVLADHALALRYFSMAERDKSKLLAMVKADPAAHMGWLKALLRSDPTLAGLDAEQHDGLRWSALRALDPDTVKMLQARVAQRDHLQQALHIAMATLRENAPAAHNEAMMSADVQAALAHAGEGIPER